MPEHKRDTTAPRQDEHNNSQASVEMATFGNSGLMASATAFTARRSGPIGLPSSAMMAASAERLHHVWRKASMLEIEMILAPFFAPTCVTKPSANILN